jgi:hypothetical protein
LAFLFLSHQDGIFTAARLHADVHCLLSQNVLDLWLRIVRFSRPGHNEPTTSEESGEFDEIPKIGFSSVSISVAESPICP